VAYTTKDFILTLNILGIILAIKEVQDMAEKPNLLIIQTDQQSCWTLGAYGGTLIETPYMDSIGKEGAIFQQFFTNSALCTPSRGCFMTGRYPHANGAYANNLTLGEEEVTLAHVLQNHGYDTGYSGKWHLAGEARPGWMDAVDMDSKGFADCRYMFNRGHWKSIIESSEGSPLVSTEIGDEQTYTTDWLTTKAIDFIRKPRSRPFFLMLSLPDPHDPYTVREPYASIYDPNVMDVPETFNDSDRPRGLVGGKSDIRGKWDEHKLRETKASYCGEVKCIDDNVGRLLRTLSECGILDDTIVVFTSDHGEYMGEHGFMHKNNLYETAYRIPLMIRWPAVIKQATIVNRLVAIVDFQQTITGLLGIGSSGREQGRDASPFLRGESIEWKDEAFIHHSSQQKIGLFTDQFELAYVKDGDDILFDRVKDPLQQINLFGHSGFRLQVAAMTETIIRHCERTACPELAWLTEKLQISEV
jgi:arylsulfatase A-like enzyme